MKPFKTIEEQIELLKSRNLKFKDENKAYEYLLHYNYYNVVNCYSKFFYEKNNKYYDDAYFEDILEIHHFDKELKSIILKSIIEAERHFKSILAYRYSEYFKDSKYSYLDSSNYDKKYIFKVTRLLNNLTNVILNKEKDKNLNSIKHYKKKYNHIPFWILVDYLTFGEIKHFYNYIPEKIRNNVAKDLVHFLKSNNLNTDAELTTNIIQITLNNLLELRNITAHNNILLGIKLPNNIPYYSIVHNFHNIPKNSPRQDIYNTIIFLKIFLTNNQYATLSNTIRKRMKSLKRKLSPTYYDKVIKSLGLPEKIEKVELN